MCDLFVDELCAHLVLLAVVPGGEDLLTEEETPGSVLLLPSSPLHFLLTLGDGIHHVLPAAAQSPHLQCETVKVMDIYIYYKATVICTVKHQKTLKRPITLQQLI